MYYDNQYISRQPCFRSVRSYDVARQEQGLELSAVSTRTKITLSYLEAIEADDRKKFPSGFFYRSFVEQYARRCRWTRREINSELDRVLAADAPLPLPGQEGNPIQRSRAGATYGPRFRYGCAIASVASLLLVILGGAGEFIPGGTMAAFRSICRCCAVLYEHPAGSGSMRTRVRAS